MKRYSDYGGLRTAAVSAVLAVFAVSAPYGHGNSHALARGLSHVRPAAAGCEGDACSQVTVTFDESKQQYRVRNNSADQWARVTASNMAASASACLAPGESAYLPLKSIAGTYQAEYAEARCGEQSASGPPRGR